MVISEGFIFYYNFAYLHNVHFSLPIYLKGLIVCELSLNNFLKHISEHVYTEKLCLFFFVTGKHQGGVVLLHVWIMLLKRLFNLPGKFVFITYLFITGLSVLFVVQKSQLCCDCRFSQVKKIKIVFV